MWPTLSYQYHDPIAPKSLQSKMCPSPSPVSVKTNNKTHLYRHLFSATFSHLSASHHLKLTQLLPSLASGLILKGTLCMNARFPQNAETANKLFPPAGWLWLFYHNHYLSKREALLCFRLSSLGSSLVGSSEDWKKVVTHVDDITCSAEMASLTDAFSQLSSTNLSKTKQTLKYKSMENLLRVYFSFYCYQQDL